LKTEYAEAVRSEAHCSRSPKENNAAMLASNRNGPVRPADQLRPPRPKSTKRLRIEMIGDLSCELRTIVQTVHYLQRIYV
jgi:hypothetical protein